MNPGCTGWAAWTEEACATVAAAGRWRAPRTFDAAGPAGRLEVAPGRQATVVSFASNDYLGLATHPAVTAATIAAVGRWGAGSGASRLITGSRPVHAELEEALAGWKGCERAAVLPTGFATNLAVLSVFGAEGTHLFSDALNHASIIDGCRMARGRTTVYPHGDLDALEAGLRGAEGRPLIVTDTVFSMDGDAADLEALCALSVRHGALLVLDEAHAVLGPELPSGTGADILRVGTMSKTLGSLGGFVAGPAPFIDLLVNRARPYIFTTAPSPADAAAGLAAVGVVRSAEGARLRARLAALVDRVAVAVGLEGHSSPILPLVVGEEDDAVAASARLLDEGLWVPAIRPPTVPVGTSRLRVTLSAAHTDAEVDRLVGALCRVGLAAAPAGVLTR